MFTPIVLFGILVYFLITALPSMYVFVKLSDRWTTTNPMTPKVALAMIVSVVNFMGPHIMMMYFLRHPLIIT